MFYITLTYLLITQIHFDWKILYIHDFQIFIQLIRQWCQTLFSRFNSQDVLLCEEHFLKQCELYCEDCDVPICIFCVSSQRHKTHDINNIRGIFEVQKEILQRDLQKLRCSIYPKYQEYALEIRRQKANVDNNSKKLNVLLTEQGKVWHKEIDKIINKMKSEIGEINVKSLNALKE